MHHGKKRSQKTKPGPQIKYTLEYTPGHLLVEDTAATIALPHNSRKIQSLVAPELVASGGGGKMKEWHYIHASDHTRWLVEEEVRRGEVEGKRFTFVLNRIARQVPFDWYHHKIQFFSEPPALYATHVPSGPAKTIAPGAEMTGNAQIVGTFGAPFVLEGLFCEADAEAGDIARRRYIFRDGYMEGKGPGTCASTTMTMQHHRTRTNGHTHPRHPAGRGAMPF
ncbi:hypothetical protein H4582DRAFT_2056792 [Lactarius indigo]|nr:hypothetical protein H4582DRAFT_2056792 [Lactarius indigo]